jgi:hypothetical protein
MAYEVSSVHISGYLKAARELKVLDAALPLLPPETRAIVDAPHRKSWVHAEVIQQLTVAIAQTAQPEVLADLNYLMCRDSLGPIVMPVLKVAIALTGRHPQTVFSRLNELVSAAMRGVEITWTPRGASAGAVVMRYPEAMPPIVHHAWHGVFKFGFELAGRRPREITHAYTDGGKTLRFELEWA